MWIVCDNIRSAWNIGAIMRSCEGVGAGVVLLGYSPLPVGKNLKLIEKTAIGADKTVNWIHFDLAINLLENYPKNTQNTHIGIEIDEFSTPIYSFLKDQKNVEKLNSSNNIFLWLGNEIHGLSRDLTQQFDFTAHLPMRGKKESLNVSNCATTVLYLFDFVLTENSRLNSN